MNNGKGSTLRVSMMCFGIALGALVILTLVGTAHTVRAKDAPSERVAYNFVPATGYGPTGVIRDSAGNLYVANDNGGSNQSCTNGCGNILKVNPSGQGTELYAFPSGTENGGPAPTGLIMDAEGNLYGATAFGGPTAIGSIFKLTSSGVESTLYSFPNTTRGRYPSGNLAMDLARNLYGVTSEGGISCAAPGCGVIYEVSPSGSQKVLYEFTGGANGGAPFYGPLRDSAGNLYGTTPGGGDLSCSLNLGEGCGTVWKLDTAGNFSVLYSFTGTTDGAVPYAGLVMDFSGNLYGDASGGGDLSCSPPFGCGTVFEINSSGNFSVLHTFSGGAADGQFPYTTLLRDSAGNLYGTTEEGGDQSCSLFGSTGCGVVFKLTASGTETIQHAFTGGTTDGAIPQYYPLVSDGNGNLYGTTQSGGGGQRRSHIRSPRIAVRRRHSVRRSGPRFTQIFSKEEEQDDK
jgi:uncharacterized repeat protein (TIGR03803 family)